MKKLKQVGVQSFKITGREMTDDQYYNELMRFVQRSIEAKSLS